MTFLKLA